MKWHLVAALAFAVAACSGSSSSGTGASGSTGAGTSGGAASTTSGGSSAGTTTGTNSGSATTTSTTSTAGSIGGSTGVSGSGASTTSGSSGAANAIDGGQAFEVQSALAGISRADGGRLYGAVEVLQTDLSASDFVCGAPSDAGAFAQLFHAAIVETVANRDGGTLGPGSYPFDLLNPFFDGGGYSTELVITTLNAWPDGGGPRFIAVQGSVTYDALSPSGVRGRYQGQLVDYWAAVANSLVDAGQVSGTFDAPVCP